jgi:hypothetical protein
MGARRSIGAGAVVAAALVALGAPAWAQVLGEAGESCRARADCREGLRCVENTCTEPPAGACESDADCAEGQTCSEGACAAARDEAAAGAAPEQGEAEGADAVGDEPAGGRWADFRLEGTHFFAGVTFAPGLTGFWPYGGDLPVWFGFLFALRAGVLFGRTELSIELAPDTWVWDFDPGEHPHFTDHSYSGNVESLTFLVNVGGLIRLADSVSWPLRFGLGLAAVELPLTSVYMQGRLDLIGLAYQYGHLLFELNLPSIRFSSEFRNVGIWGWLFTLSVSYVI